MFTVSRQTCCRTANHSTAAAPRLSQQIEPFGPYLPKKPTVLTKGNAFDFMFHFCYMAVHYSSEAIKLLVFGRQSTAEIHASPRQKGRISCTIRNLLSAQGYPKDMIVGYLLLAICAGSITSVVALLSGASFMTAFLLYAAVGTLTLVAVALTSALIRAVRRHAHKRTIAKRPQGAQNIDLAKPSAHRI